MGNMLGGVTFGAGFASGIDFRAVIDALLTLQRQPVNQLESRISTFERAKSSFTDLEERLTSFQGVLEGLQSSSTIGGKTATLNSDTAPFTASAASNAAVGGYDIDVTQIAAANRVRSDGFSDRYSPLIADGTLTIQAGGEQLITINVSEANGNNSLQAVANQINGEDKGVVATIVNDGTDDILIVRSEKTGTDSALTITDTTDLNLDDAGNVLQAAQDATLTVDGIAITSQSNSVTSAIQGVTLNLTGTTTSTVTLTVGEDTESAKQAIRDFVEAYNEVNDYFQQQFGDAASQEVSAVASNGVVRNIQRQVQATLVSQLTGIPTGKINSLAELGVETADGTGRIEFKESAFDDIVEAGRFDEVQAVLRSSGSSTDAAARYVGAGSKTVAGTYAITVSTAAEKAQVDGSTAVSAGGISQNENLTITVNNSSVSVALTAGDTIDTIVSKINTQLSADGLEAKAFNNGGAVQVLADEYGAAFTVKAVSDVADPADGTTSGIGTTEISDTGVDVVGTIGGTAATGSGQVLIGANGTDAEGLRVQIYATASSVASKGGDFGQVGFSKGISDMFLSTIEDLIDPTEGIIKVARDGYDASINQARDRIESLEMRLERREGMLVRQFAAAENAISQLQQMQASLQGRV